MNWIFWMGVGALMGSIFDGNGSIIVGVLLMTLGFGMWMGG